MNRFNTGQEYAYNVMKSGCNVFITGGAGVGKTYTADKFITNMVNKGFNIVVCAPTGIAAQALGGTTMHRQFSIPRGVVTSYLGNAYSYDETLDNTDILIIDEISMCRIDTFDFVANKVLYANKRRKDAGKRIIQIIVIGDFMQLAPVIVNGEDRILENHYGKDIGAGFAFMSKFWKLFNFKTVILTEVMRQDAQEREFIENLNRVRAGEKAYIDMIYNRSCRQYIQGAITICGTNREVSEINSKNFSIINEPYMQYEADIQYTSEYDGIQPVSSNETTFELSLEVKKGARVMLLRNDKQGRFNNGTLGTIEEAYDNTIIVTLDNGIGTVNIERVTEEIVRYDTEELQEAVRLENGLTKRYNVAKKIIAIIGQFPIKLAYAITMHKSQGQTYESANISPYSWDCGQLYVAISRVRSLNRLHFNYEPDIKYLVISLNVIKFYNEMAKEQSNKQEHTSPIIAEKTSTSKDSSQDTSNGSDSSNSSDMEHILNKLSII